MNQHSFMKPTKKIVFLMALAAGLTLTPQEMYAYERVQGVQQTDGKVTGRVVDQNGEAVIGATIKVKGTNTGAITDLDGNFAIKAKAGQELEISYVGMKPLTVKATASVMNIVMKDDTHTLNEVVVVGFGTQKKVNLTGAVAMVGGDDLAERPVTSAAQALQGMMPGLQISSSSGSMDATTSINVRGTGTIGQGSSGSPLILIDGAEGDINTVNPQDIENISVLKDAAASSIYGSRAPFGVILITTKKGKSGKPTVNYNNSFRISNLISQKHTMNSVDFASWMNDQYNNMGWGTFFNDERMAKIKAYHEATPVGPGTRQDKNGNLLYGIEAVDGVYKDGYAYGVDDVDWYDAIFKGSTFSMEHNASVSGGTDAVDYYASFNYLNNNGFMKLADDKFNRYTGTAKLGVKITDWIKMNYNMRWARTDFERPAKLTESLYNDMARQGWPILPLYDRNGHYVDSPAPALGLATAGADRRQRDILTHQIGFVLEPIKNWQTHFDFTYRTENTTRHWEKQMTYNYDENGDPWVYDNSSNVHEDAYKENYFNFQAYSEYTFQLAKRHNFHVLAGFQAEQMKTLAFGVQRNGILDPTRTEIDLTSGLGYDGVAIVPSVNGARNQWQTAGFFGRINYNYDERYLLEFNIRHDGTSRFRRANMWKTFPSVSLGWNIAREKFWEPLVNTINTLKLRASYGSLGNQNTNNWYQTYQTVAYNSAAGSWLQNGKKPNTTYAPGLVSTLLTWERIESWDIGLDFGLFNNRLTGSFDYYVRNTKDMVGNAPELPSILGTGVPVTNNTDLRTLGWEFQLTWRDRLANGLSYSATFNISDARTKITRYPNNPTNSIDNYIAGRYINEIWGYETKGLAKTQAEMDEHLSKVDQSSVGDKWAAGDIMYADLDGDGAITQGARTLDDHGDLKVLGNSTPRFLTGLDLSASWKGFDMRAFFQGVLKRDFALTGSWGGGAEYLFGSTNSGQWWAAGITAVNDYFRDENTWSVQNGYREANTDAWLPRVLYSDKNIKCQSRYLLNAAYVRLKNLQFGYTLPKSVLNHIGLNNVRFFVSMENLFTITSLPDQFDPETIGTDHSNGYPLQRTYSFGLNVTF